MVVCVGTTQKSLCFFKVWLCVGLQVFSNNVFFSTAILEPGSNLFLHFLLCSQWNSTKVQKTLFFVKATSTGFACFFVFPCFASYEILQCRKQGKKELSHKYIELEVGMAGRNLTKREQLIPWKSLTCWTVLVRGMLLFSVLFLHWVKQLF